jgi:anchored repeat ABC transporter substrate-binding protein
VTPSTGRSARALVPAVLAIVLFVSACGSPTGLRSQSDRVQVVTTTGILADLVRHVGGERVDVVSLVPDRADPHTYEPSLRDVRDIVYADLAFSNYLLLEQQSIIAALDANLGEGVPNVSLAEEAVKYAAELIPLVENVSLDTIWLGLRVRGDGAELGATRTSQVTLRATDVRGPGDMVAYLTGSFGEADRYVDSTDGFDAASGYGSDAVELPPAAHSHMSWAFTEPGVYELDLQASLQVRRTDRPVPVGAATVRFAVGVDPAGAGTGGSTVLDEGHADITVDLARRDIVLVHDPEGGGEATQRVVDPTTAVIEVPNAALHEVPPDPSLRFLGRAGDLIHQLPQAVLGKHVHGEIDPHLWQDVGNAMAYVALIRDELVSVDPAGAAEYRASAESYLEELEALDEHVRETILAIPERRRLLVTTHDAFGYLANAYDLEIAGFVTPNPASEPSLLDRRRLTATVRDLEIPAVFLEPNLIARASMLTEVAKEQGVRVCPIYGDTFDDRVHSYVDMMRANAASLRRCLS